MNASSSRHNDFIELKDETATWLLFIPNDIELTDRGGVNFLPGVTDSEYQCILVLPCPIVKKNSKR